MSNGIKLGIFALENSGKTTIISNIKDALVVSTDNKAFTGKVAHYRYAKYEGLEHFIDTLHEKVEKYQERYGKLPRTIVIDSITHLTNSIDKYCNDKYTGFNVYSNLSKDILALNAFFEEEIIPAGINIVMTGHVLYDADTAKFRIPCSGSFGKTGAWLSVLDNAAYIEVKGNKRTIHHKTSKFPCRSILDIEESQDVSTYDINEHIEMLEALNTDSEEFVL